MERVRREPSKLGAIAPSDVGHFSLVSDACGTGCHAAGEVHDGPARDRVDSSTSSWGSRTAASAGVSPGSTLPAGNCQDSSPSLIWRWIRSTRPPATMTAAAIVGCVSLTRPPDPLSLRHPPVCRRPPIREWAGVGGAGLAGGDRAAAWPGGPEGGLLGYAWTAEDGASPELEAPPEARSATTPPPSERSLHVGPDRELVRLRPGVRTGVASTLMPWRR